MPARKTPHPLLVATGQRIREIREAKNLTLEDVVRRIGRRGLRDANMRKGMLSNIERGLSSISFFDAVRIAEALEVSVAALVAEEAPNAGAS